jgi:hypothetical protein
MALGIAVLIMVYASFDTAGAEVPRMIQYQGRLTDDAGSPLDTTVELKFRIYHDSTGGSVLWTEIHPAVTVTEGLFTAKLGSITPFGNSVFNGTQRWLAISIDGGAFLQPYSPIVSTAYSIGSQHSDTATYAVTAGHATTSQHADTADIALGGSGNGWTDAGSIVSLATTSDSVGIGTIDPRVPLEVQGSVTAIIGESHGSGMSIGVLGGNDSDGIGIMGTSNSGRGVSGVSTTGFGGHFYGPKSYISSNLGVGTETPVEMLHIYKNSSGTSSYVKIQSDHASNWGEAGLRFQTPQNTWHFRMDDDANNNMPYGGLGLRSHSLDAEVMTWRDNGNVGIGTTGPNYPLEVVSSDTPLRSRSTGSGIGVYASSSSGFGVYSDAPKNFMGGLTGFGQTNPTHRITVNGAIGLQQSGTTKYHLNYYNNGFNISETNVADYRLYIKAGGNVGIGTSNPTAKLHVAGTLHADSFEADAINNYNISDEVGVAGASATGGELLATSWSSHLSFEITVPSAGYVLALGDAYLSLYHGVSGITDGHIAISDLPDDPNGSFSQSFHLYSNVPAGYYGTSVSCQRLFDVASAGVYTYYMIAERDPDNEAHIYSKQMRLIFIPTSYASKNGQTITDIEDRNPEVEAIPDNYLNSNRDAHGEGSMANSLGGEELGALVSRLESLTTEIEALKNRILTLENK